MLMNSDDTNNSLRLFSQCAGKYCGRISNISSCTACFWGSRVLSRPSKQYGFCEVCLTSLSFHDWLYLGFLAILPVLFLLSTLPTIAKSSKIFIKRQEKTVSEIQANIHDIYSNSVGLDQKSWIFSFVCISVHICTSLMTIILFPPFGSLSLYHCPVERIDDFYAPFLAASGCSYEVNFPLTSMPVVYYFISAFICLIVYPLLFIVIFNDYKWFKYLYLALYAYPVICISLLLLEGYYTMFFHIF
ncbi:unnamed protein product [Heterobilharzia americana]|nr:unnamed protein product [Heterobilharzia americana]